MSGYYRLEIERERNQLLSRLSEAQEAAENYHEAWQDALTAYGYLTGCPFCGNWGPEDGCRECLLKQNQKLKQDLGEWVKKYSDFSEIHTKVQVKWGADVDRLNVLLDGLCDIINFSRISYRLRQQLEALVNRVEDDLQRNPRGE